MIRELKRQLISLYQDSDSGFIVIRGEKVTYMNMAALKIFNSNRSNCSLSTLFDTFLVGHIRNCIQNNDAGFIRNVKISGCMYNVMISVMNSTAFVCVKKQDDIERYRENAKFNSKFITALTKYKKLIYTNAYNALADMNKGNINNAEISIDKSMNMLLNLDAIIEETSDIIWSKSGKIEPVLSSELLNNIRANLRIVISGVNFEITKSAERNIVYCDVEALQKAIYCTVSALTRQSKFAHIEISMREVNNNYAIIFNCKDANWSDDQFAFYRAKENEKLYDFICVYGYDMHRARNCMEWQEGEMFVNKTDEGGIEICLLLPEKPMHNDILISKSERVCYMNEKEVRILLSESLICEEK